jgi:hypothetical protein
LEFGCVDESGVLWPDTHDPQFMLRCVETLIENNATTNVTDDDHDDDEHDHDHSSNTTTTSGGGKSSASIKVLSGHIIALAVGAVTVLVFAGWM